MKPSISIDPIDFNHRFAPIAARWVHEEWGIGENRTLKETTERLFEHTNAPLTHIVTENGEPIGVLSFARYKLPEQSKPSLWISVVFVAPSHRGVGIGSCLVSFAEEMAVAFENRLFVNTDVPDFYRQFGWIEIKPQTETTCAILEQVLS